MPMPTVPRFLSSGDTALVVEFGDAVDRHVSALVLGLARRLAAAAIAGVVEVVPTFRSLMVHYDSLHIGGAELRARIEPMLAGLEAAEQPGRVWHIPACYDPSLGVDLAEVAQRTGLSAAQVVERHSATTFHVYMMGFLPGFPYMGDLPRELALPRRENPRTRVPRGSVAVAMTMASIYTLESPGGWHILGRTPAPLWDARRERPALLAAGDKVTFQPISLGDYETLLARAEAGDWQIAPHEAGP